MLKIYPTLVMPGTKLFLDYKQGKFVPYSTEQAAEVISEAAKYIPRYCRLMRVQRDIPSKFSSAGVSKNNLRQLVDARMREKGYVLQDIRAREIRLEKAVAPLDFEIIEYAASGGKEFFISLVDSNDRLLGFARLRFPSANLRKEFNGNTAMIRELHVYGQAAVVGAGEENAQHRGFGKKLMQKAEELAVKNGYLKMLVISGIGVRGYYKMLGYSLEGPYMSKFLDGTEGFNGLVR